MTIPLLRPSCTQAEIDAITEVLRSGWWGLGKKCEEFENKLAVLYGMKHCITVNSATAALHLSMVVNDIKEGDEIIVPALTFISTALAVTYCKATPIFADVYENSLTMDWDDVVSKITPKTKAIIPVDYAGYPAGPITVGLSSAITIVQDAAHHCGGIAYGDLVCLSFHPVKNLAMGDGGAILTNDDRKATRLRTLRWCGINKSTWEREKTRYNWDYDITEIGYKYNLNDLQAAIGLVQLDRLTKMNNRRREIALLYIELLKGKVDLPIDHPNHTWHLFPIRVDNRNQLIDYMRNCNISVGCHYKPLTLYPMYNNQITPLVTNKEWQRLVSLPIFYDLTNEQVQEISQHIIDFLGN